MSCSPRPLLIATIFAALAFASAADADLTTLTIDKMSRRQAQGHTHASVTW
jgi:hypothetical protein